MDERQGTPSPQFPPPPAPLPAPDEPALPWAAEASAEPTEDPAQPAGEPAPLPAADSLTGSPSLAEALTAIPPPPHPPLTLDAPTSEAQTPKTPAPRSRWVRAVRAIVGPVTFLILVVLGTVFVYPLLLARWRSIEGEAEAEAAFKRRRAELRAEAEAAGEMLSTLDRRVNLVSLGFREVVRKVTPNVVNVANFRELRGDEGAKRPPGSLFLDPDTERPYRQLGVGSGLIVRPGVILTNHHVVRGADRLRITFASGQAVGVPLDANVLVDPVTDLAVIRLSADLPCSLAEDVNLSCEFANSDLDVQRGDLVLAVGSPLGLKQSVTHGIISAKGRLLDKITLVELLQTDAAINPGNSGGPLFDQYGRVVGINVAIASDNGANQGIGFAIPSNTARKVLGQLLLQGVVPRGYIGVALTELTGAQAEALELKRSGGVRVTEVMPGEAAARAGLKPGDVIVRYNRDALSPVSPMRQLRGWIVDTEVGREVPVEILRDGRRQTLTLRIGKRPADLP